jgi:hypothetical protein
MSYSPIRLDYPCVEEWSAQHQVLVTACLACLAIAHLLSRPDCLNSHDRFYNGVSCVVPVMLTSCSSAMLNCMLMLGASQHIILRAATPAGQFADMFVLAGSSLKSRCSRYVWKIKLQFIVVASFFIGGVIGAEEWFASWLLALPIAMIAPLWLFGLCLLSYQRWLLSAPVTPAACPTSTPPASLSLPASTAPPHHDLRHATADTVQAPVARLPRISVLEELHEFENEGLGLRIVRLPRLNVLEDEFSNYGLPDASVPKNEPGEYEQLPYAHIGWVAYLAVVAGAINCVMLQGIFRMIGSPSVGVVNLMSARLRFPPKSLATGHASYSSAVIFFMLLVFGVATLLCGILLTQQSADKSTSLNYILLKIDYPSVKMWRGTHQVVLTACILCLSASAAIAQAANGGNRDWVDDINVHAHGNASFISALMLAASASGLLNTLCFLGRKMTIRATHQTSNLNDLFFVLGFALRTRSLRYIWRARLLLLSCVAHLSGGVLACVVFESSFGASSMYFPAILLLPAWLAGGVLLVVQCRTAPASHHISLQKRLMENASLY